MRGAGAEKAAERRFKLAAKRGGWTLPLGCRAGPAAGRTAL